MVAFLRTPHGILLTFGSALLAVALFTVIDAGRRPHLEAIVYPTGAGDRNFYQPPADLTLTSELLRAGGHPYRPAQLKPVKVADIKMVPVGQDDSGTRRLYRYSVTGTPGERGNGLHLKLNFNRYLPLTPAPAEP
jgi:hypothetical protein